ncbi:MAG: serine/threonine protein kinase [Planctomycetales bacterium]|nr:serine/threonine protein kinase [Planctomycetales bacterium]
MQATECPSQTQLKKYVSGRLSAEDSAILESHFSECERCEQTITALEAEPDSLVELVQQSQTDSSANQSRIQSDFGGGHLWPNFQLPPQVASYELIKQLGCGGMGTVFLARHRSLDRSVAMKLLPAMPHRADEFVARFRREMRAVGKLDHPAIVRSTDAGEADGIHYLVMDAIDGMDISRLARQLGRLSICDACEIVRQAALGLAHAHEKGIVHRDIKPSNLMLDRTGVVRILDFGLAQVGWWDREGAEITTVGQLMGTLDYMAPEQAERGGAVDYRADLYSLGATLFRLLTDRPPLAATPDLSPLEKLRLLATHRAPKLATLRTDAPSELCQFVDSMLARDPNRRPASAAHVAELLESFAAAADLATLIVEVESRPKLDEQPATNGRPYFMPRLPVEQESSTATTSSRANQTSAGRGNYWANMLAVVCVLAACGGGFWGLWLVLETGKGQLVIESEVGDLGVRLLQDGHPDELLSIHPGTQSTRLRSGQYEILLDTASDSVTLNQDTFFIQRGDVVVARISRRAVGEGGVSSQSAADKASTDSRLTQATYAGETLDTWLQRVKFERADTERERALAAIGELAAPEFSDVIVPVLTEALEKEPFSRSIWYPLVACSGDSFLSEVAEVLSKADSPALRAQLLRGFSQIGIYQRSNVPVDVRPFYDALRRSFDSEDVAEHDAAIVAALKIMQSPVPEMNGLQSTVIGWLDKEGVLDDAATVLAVVPNKLYNNAFREDWNNRIDARLAKWIFDDVLSANIKVKAAVLLRSRIDAGAKFEAKILEEMEQSLTQYLQQVSPEDNRSLELVRFTSQGNQDGFFSTNLGVDEKISGMESLSASEEMCELTAVLNVLQSLLDSEQLSIGSWQASSASPVFEDQAIDLSTALLDCHLRFEQQPININLAPTIFNTRVTVANSRSPIQEHRVEQVFESGLTEVWRFHYFHTGRLLGRSFDELQARLAEIMRADRAEIVKSMLEKLERDDISASQLRLLERNLIIDDASQAIPILQRSILRDFAERGPHNERPTFTLLCRVSKESFVANFVTVLEEGSTFLRQLFLNFDITRCDGFTCLEPQSIVPLLEYVQALTASEPDSTERHWLFQGRFLRALLKNGAKGISEDCQRELSLGLERIDKLHEDDFWFFEPVDSYCLPFREAVARKAIVILASEHATIEFEARIMVALRSTGLGASFLSSAERTLLIDLLARHLKEIPEAPGSSVSEIPFDAKWVTPDFDNIVISGGSVSAVPAWQILGLIAQFELVDQLKLPLKEAFEWAQAHEYSEDFFSTRGIAPWYYQLDRPEVIIQGIYLLSGTMLGHDPTELRQRPQRVAEKLASQVQPGDTLAIYIPRVLPVSGDPPILQAGTRRPVVGFPVNVDADGFIQIPSFKKIEVRGMELPAIVSILETEFNEVFKSVGGMDGITVNFLMRAQEHFEIRSLVGPQKPK